MNGASPWPAVLVTLGLGALAYTVWQYRQGYFPTTSAEAIRAIQGHFDQAYGAVPEGQWSAEPGPDGSWDILLQRGDGEGLARLYPNGRVVLLVSEEEAAL